jgi:amino acid adenylation domain-containing protein
MRPSDIAQPGHGVSVDEPYFDHLAAGFVRSAIASPQRPALIVGNRSYSYEELLSSSAAIAALLTEQTDDAAPRRTAVFAHRSFVAYAGLLGALLRGHGYVPLNRKFPIMRTKAMFERSGCRALIIDNESLPQLDELLTGVEKGTLVLAPELEDVRDLESRLTDHVVLGRDAMRDAAAPVLRRPGPDDVAYLLFTSGSTGQPKGVMVAHRNVAPFVRAMADRYGVSPHDQCSQTFDLTFDLSVFDLFVAWERGACVHCLPDKTLLKPGGYIREHELTLWFSVPSTAMFLQRFGMLKAGSYPSLRWSLFCGEALPVGVAEAWAAAAPNSIVENLYGPTEATIACTIYRWEGSRSRAESRLGSVPIGSPITGMSALVVDGELREVGEEHEGELLVAGRQVALGYLDDPERTQSAFVVPSGKVETHYRTGDRVVRASNGVLHYLGRLDHQVQVHGHRVELGEVESAIRDSTGAAAVVALGWPVLESGVGGIVAFVAGEDAFDQAALRTKLAALLPDYMVPREVHVLRELPLNANGKFDRPALRARLEAS